jgi:WD40 repeat protein/tRNA A-37 threonylcarbamoyl transferase component Bud32
MHHCPHPELIADLLADRLGDADRAALEEHIEHCPACQEALNHHTGDGDTSRWQELYAGLPRPDEAEVPGLGHLLGGLAPTGSAPTATPGPPREPSSPGFPTLAGYEILGELGRGGMGVVYKARQTGLKRLVALKVILAGARAGTRERARFRTEAEAAARLQHPNVVQVYEISEQDGLLHLALEFIDGNSLAQKIAGAPQPPRAAAELIEVLSRAIQSAHEHNIVHRDLKPSNVLLTRDGVPKIADFGLAKRLDDASAPTESGSILGTPSYMAPEQVRGRGHGIGPATDVYALGAILYEMLTGRAPFKGASPMDTVLQVIHDEPVPPSRLQRRIPPDLETVCLKCLAREPDGRYPSAAALGDDLRRFLDGAPIRARPAGRLKAAWKWARRRPGVAALLLAVVLVTALGFAGTLGQWYEAAGARDRALDERRQKEEQWRAAEAARAEAEAARAEAETALYYSRIAQSELLWRAGDLTGAEQALALGVPREGGRDRRGWEWRYLQGLYHRELFALPSASGDLGGCAAFRPDGRQIAAVVMGHDARPADLRVWDAADGSLVAAWHVATGVHRLAYSPDGTRLALGEVSGWVRVCDAATGKALFASRLHNSLVSGLDFSPDGRRLATGGWDKLVKVSDSATGEVLRECKGHTERVQGVAFHPDGRHLVSGSRDHTARVWDTETGQEVHKLEGHSDSVFGVAISPDGRCLASAGADGSIKLWDTKTGQVLVSPTGHEAAVLGVAFSSDGRYLASGGGDRTVWVWDVASGARRMAFRGHSAEVSSVAFDPEGRRLLSFSPPQGMAKVWDLTRHPEYDTIGRTPAEAEAMVFRPDARHLLTVSRGGSLRTWDTVAGLLVGERSVAMTERLSSPATVAAFDPAGRSLAGLAAEDLRVLKVWDVEAATEPVALRGHTKIPLAVRFSRDRRYVASAAWSSGAPTHEVKVWDAADGKLLAEWTGDGRVWGLDFSPDGRLLAAAGPGRSLTVVDWQTRRTVLDVAGDGRATAVAFSPDGKQVASAEPDGAALKIWDLTEGDGRSTGQPRHTLRGFDQPYGLAYSPDGRRLAAVSRDAVKVWDAETGREVFTLRGAPRRAWDPAFNPQVTFSSDGKRLAATNWDQTISVWEAEGQVADRARDLRRAADERTPVWHLVEAEACLEKKNAAGVAFHARYLRDAAVPQPLLSRRDRILLATGP